jgi:hypothetical protein
VLRRAAAFRLERDALLWNSEHEAQLRARRMLPGGESRKIARGIGSSVFAAKVGARGRTDKRATHQRAAEQGGEAADCRAQRKESTGEWP